MFIQLNKLLPREIKRHGLKKEVEALDVINKFNKSAAEKLGKSAMDYLTAKVYKNKTLYIDAVNSSAAQLLFLNQHEILEAVNSLKTGVEVASCIKPAKVEKFVIKTVGPFSTSSGSHKTAIEKSRYSL
ncbi:DUF721 domain-containing protein [Candidatus Peregrinibacteria bacterium]|nr:DUF721 domain-containing protein [Candidatus Peregrinibacteria bacterium]